MKASEPIRTQLHRAGRAMIEGGLTWGNAGNLSARLDSDQFLITASGTRLGELVDGDFALCSLRGTMETTVRPSKELPLHRAVYGARPEVGAVLHGAPFYSTLVACSSLPIPSDLFVESMYYLERVARVPYHHPGSDALGEAVRAQAGDADVLLLENHGVLVFDTSISGALQALQVLELTCRMLVTAKSSGIELTPLAPETVDDFLEHAGYKPRRRGRS